MKASTPMQPNDPKLHAYMTHAITEYDRRQERAAIKARRPHNIYALSHYCGAVQRISADIAGGAEIRAAILTHLCGSLASFVLRTIGHAAITNAEARG
jgi:hypothetical protein